MYKYPYCLYNVCHIEATGKMLECSKCPRYEECEGKETKDEENNK